MTTRALTKPASASRSRDLAPAEPKRVAFDELGAQLSQMSEIADCLRDWRQGLNRTLWDEPMTLEWLKEMGPVWIEQAQALGRQLEDAIAPAPRSEIAKSVTVLAGCFPNADAKDLTVYGQMLVRDIENLRPTRIQLERALTKVRRSKTFLPAIAEVLVVIEGTASYASYRQTLHDVVTIATNAETIDREKRARGRKWEETRAKDSVDRRARLVAECADRIVKGYDTRHLFSEDIVDEAVPIARDRMNAEARERKRLAAVSS